MIRRAQRLLLASIVASGVAGLMPGIGGLGPDLAFARGPVTTVDLGPAHLLVDDAWTVDAGAAPPIVARGDDDAVLIATRAAAPNLAAWSRATRDAHVDELVAGFTAVDGATVLRRSVTTDGPSRVPVLDLTLLRGGRPVAIRVILFRTLTVAAAATADRDDAATRAALERAVAGLHPDR